MNPYLQNILHDITVRITKLEEAQQRQWVDLTDKEIRALAKKPNDPNHLEIPMTGRMWVFANDLMEKLKEKNT